MSDDLRAQLKAEDASPALLKLHERRSVPLTRMSEEDRAALRSDAPANHGVEEPERTVPAPLGVDGRAHPDRAVRVARSRWLVDCGYLEPKQPSSNRNTSRPRKRGRRARRTTAAASSRSPDRPPRLCACGCGESVPPGKRAYVDDAHSNRAAQRRWYKRHRLEAPADHGRDLKADREALRLLAGQRARAARLGNPRDHVLELAEERAQLWAQLPYANGDGPAIRAEIERLTRELAAGWEAVRLEAVAA